MAGRPRALPARFPRAKPKGEFRVFVLGESSAMRLDLSSLAAALRERGLASPRLIPAGMGAYDAARTRLVLREALGLDADAVVLLLGHNEHPLLPPPSRLGRRLRNLARRLRLARWTASALPRPSEADLRGRMERRFVRSVRDMLRAARRRGAAAVVCILPSNRRDWPPKGELPIDDEDFLDAALALRGGRGALARAALGRFLARRPHDAMGLFARARLDARSDPAAAAAGFQAALGRDNPDRTTPERNAALRALAREEGAATADLEAAWAPLSSPAGPGWEVFQDGVHWRRFLDASAAALVAGALLPEGGPAPAALPLPPPPQADELESLRLLASGEALQASRGPSPFLSERAAAMFEHAAASDPASLRAFLSDPQAAARRFEENPWTASLAPDLGSSWWGVLAHAGEGFARAGREEEASEAWGRAARMNPGAPLVRLCAALDLAGRGRGAEALKALEAVPEGSREAVVAGMLRRRLTGGGR